MYADIANCFTETVLANTDLLREKHAVERWVAWNKSTAAGREQSLRQNLAKVPSYEDMLGEVEKYRVNLKKNEEIMVSVGSEAAASALQSLGAPAQRRKGFRGSTLQDVAATKPERKNDKRGGAARGAGTIVPKRTLVKRPHGLGMSPVQYAGSTGAGDESIISGGSADTARTAATTRISVAGTSRAREIEDVSVQEILNCSQKLGTRLNGARFLVAPRCFPFVSHASIR